MGIAYVGKARTIEQFRKYVCDTDLGPYNAVFVHHTATPEAAWNGKETLDAMFERYESYGWDVGPHLFVGPDFIWEGTPLTMDGAGVADHNHDTRHIETVGNYHDHLPSGSTLKNVIAATGILLQKPEPLTTYDVLQHRWYNQTECPGDAWSERWQWFRSLVQDYMDNNPLKAVGLDVMEEIRHTAFDQLNVPYNSDAAFIKKARQLSLGAPLKPEYDVIMGGTTYRVQPFAHAILYCVVGDWGNIFLRSY